MKTIQKANELVNRFIAAHEAIYSIEQEWKEMARRAEGEEYGSCYGMDIIWADVDPTLDDVRVAMIQKLHTLMLLEKEKEG